MSKPFTKNTAVLILERFPAVRGCTPITKVFVENWWGAMSTTRVHALAKEFGCTASRTMVLAALEAAVAENVLYKEKRGRTTLYGVNYQEEV